MLTKRKKVNEEAIDKRLQSFCQDLFILNPEAIFAISKIFFEKPDRSLGQETGELPIIYSTIPISELIIYSGFKILNGCYLTTWCGKEPLAKIEYCNMKFSDGEIKGKKIQNYYLEIYKNH